MAKKVNVNLSRKKYQVFVSSTFLDLRSERQAAVEAILESGHIPAGMELFTAGNKSQLEVIKSWIQQSDIYMLILGPRYGSLEADSQLSYTQIEYEYAMSLNIPLFAVVISEDHLQERISEVNVDDVEVRNRDKYSRFCEKVTSNMCEFFNDKKDIKLAIHKSIREIEHEYELVGWVKGSYVASIQAIAAEKDYLNEENSRLKNKINLLNSREEVEKKNDKIYNGLSFNEVKEILTSKDIAIKNFYKATGVEINKKNENETRTLMFLFKLLADYNSTTSNAAGTGEVESWLFYNVATPLMKYKLTEFAKVPGNVRWQKIVISSDGYGFLAELERQKLIKSKQSQDIETKPVSTQPKKISKIKKSKS